MAIGRAKGTKFMHLTWFGGSTFRALVGGRVVVTDGDLATSGFTASEIKAGADIVLALEGADPVLREIDPAIWRPLPPRRPLEGAPDEARIFALTGGGKSGGGKSGGGKSGGGLIVDGLGEPALVFLPAGADTLVAGAKMANVVVFGTGAETAGAVPGRINEIIAVMMPRLLSIAIDGFDLNDPGADFYTSGTTLMVLEPGFALNS
jgi:hypothetical protein